MLICDREINIHDESLYAGYIGTDSARQGRSAAEFLIRKFTSGNDDESPAEDDPEAEVPPRRNRPVRIVELSGTEGSSAAAKRALGFRELLEAHNAEAVSQTPETRPPQFEIIHSASGDFLRSKGYELACYILDTFDEIDVLYSHNDGMTLGAIDAMKERGIRPGLDIVIVTIDAEQAVIDALRCGEVNCVVECNPKQGTDILRLAANLAQGESIPRVTFMHEEVFSENDDLNRILLRGY